MISTHQDRFLALFIALSLTGCASFGNKMSLFDASDDARSSTDSDLPPNRAPSSDANRIRQARASRDVVVGMRMEDVISAWGEPRQVEYAGNATSGNQRWTYYTGLSSAWSTNDAHVIYFEEGQVVGWETQPH